MRVNKFLLVLTIMSTAAVMACDVYDDGIPPKDVRNEFKAMYSGAKDIDWDREGAHWKVSFDTGDLQNRVEHEAVYDASGKWILTETETYLSVVPQSVKDALSADVEYGLLPFDDNEVKFYQTPSGNFYRFELRKDGRDVEVDVTEDGKVSPAKRLLY